VFFDGDDETTQQLKNQDTPELGWEETFTRHGHGLRHIKIKRRYNENFFKDRFVIRFRLNNILSF
jgi:hypothetical protein